MKAAVLSSFPDLKPAAGNNLRSAEIAPPSDRNAESALLGALYYKDARRGCRA
jgi:hypothetical protein